MQFHPPREGNFVAPYPFAYRAAETKPSYVSLLSARVVRRLVLTCLNYNILFQANMYWLGVENVLPDMLGHESATLLSIPVEDLYLVIAYLDHKGLSPATINYIHVGHRIPA